MARPLLASLLALLVLLPWAGRARAAGEVAVPDVVGRPASEATDLLKAAGFGVHAVDVAEGEVGRVHSQVPPGGALVDPGTSVEVRVGTALRVDTTVPDVVGRLVDVALAELSPLYVVEVETVDGPAAQAGLVTEQSPAAGATLKFRGILRVRAVAGPAGEGSTIVPPLLGRTEAEARKDLEAAGLQAEVKTVEDGVAKPGQVISQDPPSGAEILRGATVVIRVAKAPAEGPVQTTVPDVVGLAVADAEKALLLAGFAVRADFVKAPGQTPWRVLEQTPFGGAGAAPGSTVDIRVALPSAPQQVPVPALLGLAVGDAKAVLAAAGLQASVLVQPSNLPLGTVFQQTPAPGTLLASGGAVTVVVAGKPPGGWTPPTVQVPSVIGLPPDTAFTKLLLAGLWPKKKWQIAPGAPLDLVSDQAPAPGTALPPGAFVSFYLPEGTTVPDLLGKSRNQAVSLLQQAGLNASPQGPAFGLGTTKVVSQSRPAGSAIAKGTTVAFAYQWTGGVIQQFVVVPSVVGLTRPQAEAALLAKNLVPNFQGPAFGIGLTEVTAQNPGPGTLAAKGTPVLVVYKFKGNFPIKVAVPALVGKTKAQAQQLLQAKGLVGQFQGPNFGLGTTKVTSQSPLAGALVSPGSTVTAVYVFTGGVIGQIAVVPNVVGLHRNAAKAKVEAAGLQVAYVGPAFGLGVPRVQSQNPAPSQIVPKGSTVKLTIVWGP